MQKGSKILLAGIMALSMALSAGTAIGATVQKKIVKKTVRKSSVIRKSVTTYPIVTKYAGTFTVTNVDKVAKVAGFEKITIKPSSTAALVTISNLVPINTAVKALGGTVTVNATTNVATINYDGKVFTLALIIKNSAQANAQKVGTVYYVKADTLGKVLVTVVNKDATGNDVTVPVTVNLTANTMIRSKTTEISKGWLASGHAHSNGAAFASPLGNNSCIKCHDGKAFNLVKSTEAGLVIPTKEQLPLFDGVRKIDPIGCSTCHPAWFGNVLEYGKTAAEGQAFLNTYYGAAVGTNAAVPKRASEIMLSGNSDLLINGLTVNGVETSALCISCHEGRKVADKSKFQAPHGANETDVVFGYGAFTDFNNDGSADFSLPAAPHAANENVCVGCHMPKVNGAPSHEMNAADKVQYTCNVCHPGMKSTERRAYGDYDGDKAVETVNNEILGLKTAVKAKLVSKVKDLMDAQLYVDKTDPANPVNVVGKIDIDIDGTGPDTGIIISGLSTDVKDANGVITDPGFATRYPNGIYTISTANYPVDVTGGGSIKFVTPVANVAVVTLEEKDAQTITTFVVKAQTSPLYYGAAFNYATTVADGSNGIHNPGYLVKLLQESYKALNDGKALPGAYLR